MQFDRELLAALQQFTDPDPSDPVAMRAAQAEQLKQLMAGVLPQDDRVTFSDRSIPGPEGAPELTVRIYRPGDHSTNSAFVYYHGGGFIAGDLDSAHVRALMIAAEVRCIVVSVAYRLAPEYRFPAAPEDCYAALVWTAQQAGVLGVDTQRIAVGGESAGGGLAAAVSLMARDRGRPDIAFQLLLYPVIDDRMRTTSMRAAFDTPIWNAGKCDIMWRHYLGDAHGRAEGDVSPYAAPGRASDVSRLPPAYISTCEGDPLRDEAIDYAQRLLQADIAVELHQFPNTFHGFDLIGLTTEIGQRALHEQFEVLRRAFDRMTDHRTP